MLTRRTLLKGSIKWILSLIFLGSIQPTMANDITIGYQGMFNPLKYAIANQLIKKKTGKTVKWRRFNSGAKVITAMASGSVQIAVAGSSPIASAVSRGVDIQLIWILENIADAEALVVRKGSGIQKPQDLKGKRLAVPFVSTTHFHALFALEQFGLTEKDVKVINMQPGAIAAAWQRGDIDAAFIWNPVLDKIKATGKVLISSRTLTDWGKPTFDGLIADSKFAKNNAEFVSQLLKVIAEVDQQYRNDKDGMDAKNPMAMAVASMSGSTPKAVVDAMSLYEFPDLKQQLSCQWLGCGKSGGASKALLATSEFLLKEKKINRVLPDYSQFVNPDYAATLKQ